MTGTGFPLCLAGLGCSRDLSHCPVVSKGHQAWSPGKLQLCGLPRVFIVAQEQGVGIRSSHLLRGKDHWPRNWGESSLPSGSSVEAAQLD